jgi:hypothetical protein
MSLLKTSWLTFAGAATFTVAIPWWVINPFDAERSEVGPPQAPRPIAISWPQIPTSALAGRLFFGLPGNGASADDANSADVANSSSAVPPLPAQNSDPTPILVGTIVNRAGSAAAILRLVNGESRVATRGDTVDGWRIGAITHGHASLTREDRTEQIAVATQTIATSVNEMGIQ